MTFHPQAPGVPGEHLGISHTLKHYLAPKELWQDVAHVVAAELRPVDFLARHFAAGTPWLHWGEAVTDAEVAKWPELATAFEQGYLHIIFEYARTHPEQTVRFRAQGQNISMLNLGDGILLQLYDRTRARVRTAYRKTGVSLHSLQAYAAISHANDCLGRRLKQARQRAMRQIKIAQSGQIDETGEG
jgi:hypothetical protein